MKIKDFIAQLSFYPEDYDITFTSSFMQDVEVMITDKDDTIIVTLDWDKVNAN